MDKCDWPSSRIEGSAGAVETLEEGEHVVKSGAFTPCSGFHSIEHCRHSAEGISSEL
jgi:hypothetical protein